MSSRVAQSFVSLQFTFVCEILHAKEQVLNFSHIVLLCNTILIIFYQALTRM